MTTRVSDYYDKYRKYKRKYNRLLTLIGGMGNRTWRSPTSPSASGESDEFRCNCPHHQVRCPRFIATINKGDRWVKRYPDDQLCPVCWAADDIVKKGGINPRMREMLQIATPEEVLWLQGDPERTPLLEFVHILYQNDAEVDWESVIKEFKALVEKTKVLPRLKPQLMEELHGRYYVSRSD